MVFKHTQRLVDHLIVSVDVGVPRLFVEHVVDDAACNIAIEQPVALANHEVASP